MKTLALFFILCLGSLALADDFKTVEGKEYKNVRVSRVEPDGLVLSSKSGISKVYFTELPKEVQERFHYDATKGDAYHAEQTAQLEALRKQQEEAQRKKAEEAARQTVVAPTPTATPVRAQGTYVTYASAINRVNENELRILSARSGNYDVNLQALKGWQVAPGEIYVFEKFQGSIGSNQQGDELSVVRMDDVVLVLRTSDIVLIRPDSPEYERAETLYKEQVKDKREQEKAAAERGR
jgi:hypothetical protein